MPLGVALVAWPSGVVFTRVHLRAVITTDVVLLIPRNVQTRPEGRAVKTGHLPRRVSGSYEKRLGYLTYGSMVGLINGLRRSEDDLLDCNKPNFLAQSSLSSSLSL